MDVNIREASVDDYDFVIYLMKDALSKFYDGDHVAHANRIFSTHLAGGRDRLGFFSQQQKMYIAEEGKHKAGMLHLVIKRQDTVKISPLIVRSDFKKRGVGRALLKHAEKMALNLAAHQLYCTVALPNERALEFFLEKGFTKLGESESHYKKNITEIMLQKNLNGELDIENYDNNHISILPFTRRYSLQVRSILLEKLPSTFKGIDDEWVDNFFNGYKRRKGLDVESKFKLIFVALDHYNKVIGVVGVTPKKGKPIKVMPFIAINTPAFVAFLKDLPFYLQSYGSKLYVHITPSVAETTALQENNWSLDVLIPAGYHPRRVTQQWSVSFDKQSMIRTIRVKEKFLNFIKQGSKDLEVRVCYPHMLTITMGEVVRLSSHINSRDVRIQSIRIYNTFEELLSQEDPNRIVPGYSKRELIKLLREIYPSNKERLGVLVLQIELTS